MSNRPWYVTSRPLISEPGEVFAYGAPGFQVAGAVVEAATGKRWAQVFQEKIAEPLGMTKTYWTHLRLDSDEELPVAETLNPVLQGGAVSTARDYLRFLSMITQEGKYEGKRVLSMNSIDELLKNQTSKTTMTSAPENPIKGAHYSLDNWCESWDETGTGHSTPALELLVSILGSKERRDISTLFSPTCGKTPSASGRR